jgi:hypothetical protein
MRAMAIPIVAGGFGVTLAVSASGTASPDRDVVSSAAQVLEYRSLDGSGNNLEDPTLGQAGAIYPRLAAANYADGIGEPVDGPAERHLSNGIFNDTNQNVFSENGVTHWSFVWGPFRPMSPSVMTTAPRPISRMRTIGQGARRATASPPWLAVNAGCSLGREGLGDSGIAAVRSRS